MKNTLTKLSSPELRLIHSGKVRDSYALDNGQRMIFVSDRISAFDRVLATPVPMKGAVLNKITNFWFTKTNRIIANHFIREIDPNLTIVKEVFPIRVEMVVRGYLSGSMWRYYQNGKRSLSGVNVPDGMTKNQKFAEPILTPTTKEDSDREITPAEIVASGLVSEANFEKMRAAALALFNFGTELLAQKGIILVDTKYEFGLDGDEVILIDEIHTPDASRFWRASDYELHPETAEQIDKEFVRLWLIENKIEKPAGESPDGKSGKKVFDYPTSLPGNIIKETTRRYLEIHSLITGSTLDEALSNNIEERVTNNLILNKIIHQ